MRARGQPGVVQAEPFVEVQGLLSNGPLLSGASLRGIDPSDHGPGTALGDAMQAGSLDSLQPGSRRIVLGRALAMQLQLNVGDPVSVLLLRTGAGGELAPRIGSFVVAGMFEIGLADHDAAVAFASLEDVAALAGPSATAGVLLFFADPFDAPNRAREAGRGARHRRGARLDRRAFGLFPRDPAREDHDDRDPAADRVGRRIQHRRQPGHGGRREAQRHRDPAHHGPVARQRGRHLHRAGDGHRLVRHAGRRRVSASCSRSMRGDIAPALERLFGFEIFDPDVYYITRIPSELRAADVLLVAGSALTLTLLATIYPARRAAATEPAEALRYE